MTFGYLGLALALDLTDIPIDCFYCLDGLLWFPANVVGSGVLKHLVLSLSHYIQYFTVLSCIRCAFDCAFDVVSLAEVRIPVIESLLLGVPKVLPVGTTLLRLQ